MRQFIIQFSFLLFAISTLLSQNDSITITGNLFDDSGEAILFASIISLPSATRSNSDFNGFYTITVPVTDSIIEVNYIGYAAERIKIDHSKKSLKLDIFLTTTVTLEEVVVREYKVPLISRDHTTSGLVVTGESIKNIKAKKAKKPEILNSESYSKIEENKFINTLDESLSTFSVDVDNASYSNMRRFIYYGEAPPKDAIRIEELINYFDYGYKYPENNHPVALESVISNCPWNDEYQLLHIALKGKELNHEQLPPSNLVFLIDVSGSMGSTNKLPLVKKSLLFLLENLKPFDRVSIVTYAGRSGIALASTSVKEKQKIINAIQALGSGGSTAGSKGIKTAYNIAKSNFIEKGNNRIILATDGDFNVGLSNNEDLKKLIEEKRKTGIFLSILAYGTGNYQDDLMQTLATHGNGNHFYIDDLDEAHKIFGKDFTGNIFPVAKDVKIQIEFNPVHVQSYRLIGYVNRILDKKDFNNDKVDASEIGSGQEVTAIYEIIPTHSNKKTNRKVDDLKYQSQGIKTSSRFFLENEIATIKFRYKNVKEDKSQKIEDIILNAPQDFEELDETKKFSICVAAFGMKLTDSKHVSKYKLQNIIHLASATKGIDEAGQKQEFIELMRKYKKIKRKT